MSDRHDDFPESHVDTTRHVRRAMGGHEESLEWIVNRFSPLLRAQVIYRLGHHLARRVSADDVVAEAWLATLPKMSELSPRDDRYTPVLLGYLGTTVRRIANRKLQSYTRGLAERPAPSGDSETVDPLGGVADDVQGVVTQALGQELASNLASCISQLDEKSREVVILRGVEGFGYGEIATQIGEQANTIAQRYYRAINQLRDCLPSSIFEELTDG